MKVPFIKDINGVTSTGPCPAEIIDELKSNGLKLMYEIYGSSETGDVGFRNDHKNGYTLLRHWEKTDQNSQLKRKNATGEHMEYSLQDIIDWHDETTFTPKRRTDNAIQIAGVNVYPSRVMKILATHPDIVDCAVRIMQPNEGTRLKAFIVPATGRKKTSQLESSIRKWAKERLSPNEMPTSWTFGHKVPVNELGKQADWRA
ncbi:hypothetical protein SYK_16220 [Pseudodesulfovibrio nedwellii]|uniref:AMP-binding enzyme C-terminal domain-containing protein n=2 Tax=Pseudodesulfovibrio nedwellii TaxID=2973072 RepID=A0ABN6S4I6_9BACT|nr:hypothetical protein SYK_16220 [Pseudodesulfovibrio nedwellii]